MRSLVRCENTHYCAVACSPQNTELGAQGASLASAHEHATVLEKELINAVEGDVIVTIHLEPEGSHEDVHRSLHDADQDRPLEDFI